MATVNWDDIATAAEEANKPAPAGRYIMQVKKVEEGQSKAGAPQIKIIWEIADGAYKGKVAFDYLTLNRDKPASISMATNTIRMLGIEDFRAWGAMDEATRCNSLVGKRIEADVSVDEYQGRKSNKIKNKIKAIAGGASNPDGLAPPPVNDMKPPSTIANPLEGI